MQRCIHCLKRDHPDNMWCIISSSTGARHYECKTKCKRSFDTRLQDTIDSMKEAREMKEDSTPLTKFWNWMKFINKN